MIQSENISTGSWADPQDWAQMARPDTVVADGERVVLFFDGSLSNDHTALVGCRMSDGHIFTVGVWEPIPGEEGERPEIDVQVVDAAVDRAMNRWDVVAFWADVREWEAYTKSVWPDRYREQLEVWAQPSGRKLEPIAWDMRSKDFDFTTAAELCEREIAQHLFTHDGNAMLTEHVHNARRFEGRYGTTVRKEARKSAKKIDACVCMIGSRLAWRTAKEHEAAHKKKPRTNEAFFI